MVFCFLPPMWVLLRPWFSKKHSDCCHSTHFTLSRLLMFVSRDVIHLLMKQRVEIWLCNSLLLWRFSDFDRLFLAQSICVRTSPWYEPDVIFYVYREIQKLVPFLVVFLGACLFQILKKMNMTSLVSFAFLVHVLIRKLQDLDRMPIKKCSTRNFDFPCYT